MEVAELADATSLSYSSWFFMIPRKHFGGGRSDIEAQGKSEVYDLLGSKGENCAGWLESQAERLNQGNVRIGE